MLSLEVDDGIPLEAEIELSVWDMKAWIAGVPLGMRAEDLKGWLREEKCNKEPVRRR